MNFLPASVDYHLQVVCLGKKSARVTLGPVGEGITFGFGGVQLWLRLLLDAGLRPRAQISWVRRWMFWSRPMASRPANIDEPP
ncbi:hypothetical protein GCM10009741_01130 [Kribbella lupini]|uniref:Uncharacterized protein n=1 Tax=Kribbella lupini TaxID=291602 RepID=A0ABN2A056_9ACTN